MKRLYILRHAKSSWAQPGLRDFDRSLNTRGENQLKALSKWFTSEPHKPTHVLCSSSLRTRATYEGIARAMGSPHCESQDSLYSGSLEGYLECLWGAPDVEVLMLIGHNPTCDELVRYLTSPSSPAIEKLMAHHFGTATLAVLDFDADNWSKLGEASCSLAQLLRPKELERAASV